MNRTFLNVSLMVCLVTLSVATDALAAASLSSINLGQYAGGPPLTKAELKDRVVLVEYWGVRCGPCIGSIPHITALQKKYGRDRFIVVANHVQTATPSQAGSKWKRHAGNDSVSVIHMGRVTGVQTKGIPHCALFDHEGKLIYSGHPSQIDAPLDAAIRKAPPFLIADRSYKALKREALSIGKMSSTFGSTFVKLKTIAADDEADADKREEASHLVKRVTTWGNTRYDLIKKQLKSNPIYAKQQLSRMVRLFRRDKDLGDKFVALDKSTRTDKDFLLEIKAAKALAILKAKAQKLGIGTIQSGGNILRAKAQFKKALKKLSDRYDGTVAGKQADQLIVDWQL